MASMGEFQDKSHCWPKITKRLVSHLPKNILIIPKMFGKIFCGLMRQKVNFFRKDAWNWLLNTSGQFNASFLNKCIDFCKNKKTKICLLLFYVMLHNRIFFSMENTCYTVLEGRIITPSCWRHAWCFKLHVGCSLDFGTELFMLIHIISSWK